MGLLADAYALLSGLLAPATVRYGRALQLAGADLPAPVSRRIRTRHGTIKADVYAARLEAEGLLIEHRVVPGRDHYFLDGDDPRQARALLGVLADHVREVAR